MKLAALVVFLPIPHFSSFLFFFFNPHSTFNLTRHLFSFFVIQPTNINTYSTSPYSNAKKDKGMPRLNARDRTEMHQMQQAQYTDGTATDLRLLHSLDDLGGLWRKGDRARKDSEEEEGDPGPISWHQRISIWMINEGMFISFCASFLCSCVCYCLV